MKTKLPHAYISSQLIHCDVMYTYSHLNSIPIHITVDPSQKLQVGAFYAPPVSELPYRAGDFVGSVAEGGSCNCFSMQVMPHCNGTHTESIGHLTTQRESVLNTGVHLQPFVARLVSVHLENGAETNESYPCAFDGSDWLVSKEKLQVEIQDLSGLGGLIIRTLPNRENEKRNQNWAEQSAPFFTSEAMEWIAVSEIQYLLVDFPSVDRAEDEGRLLNHRKFWNVPADSKEAQAESHLFRTITEMILVPDTVPDGLYLVHIQLPPIHADALPSSVFLYPLHTVDQMPNKP